MEWFWCKYGFIYFNINLVYSEAGHSEPMQEWYATFVDNKR